MGHDSDTTRQTWTDRKPLPQVIRGLASACESKPITASTITDPCPIRVTLRAQSHPTHVRRVKHSGKRERENLKNPDRPASNATLQEYCDKHYHQLLPIIAEKVHNEKVQQEKLKEVKARLNFKGAPECMRISGFMHGITNPELIKRMHDNIPKSVVETMRVTTTSLRGEVAAFNQARKKTPLIWKQQKVGRKHFDRRRDFRNQQRSKRRQKSLPFFKTFKKCTKKSDLQWTAKAEAAFKEMKRLITKLPTLIAPIEKEELIVYLAAAREPVSVVLMTKKEAKQMPVYFVSRALQGPEINYTSMEKLVLSLVHVAGGLQKWSIELGEYDIQYRPRTSVKGQILADFIVKRSEDDSLDTPIDADEELPDPWTLFRNRSPCIDGSGAGLILTNLKGAKFTYTLRFRFDATNNEAKYEALIAGLRIAKQMGVKNLQANVESRLISNQVLVEELKEKYLNKAEVLTVVEEEGHTWMTPIYNYLAEEILPAEKEKARAVRRKSRSMHAETRSVVAKAIWTRYYWLTMHADARKLIRACQDCQEGIMARLDERSKDWIEELSHVLLSHRTLIKSSNGDIPFLLVYETKAAIPAEIGMPTMRTIEVDIMQNDEALEINLDLLEERREQALIREAKSKAKMKKYYNSKVRNTSFKPGDLVYRSNEASHAKESEKLSPKWEGPYEVTEANPRTWNVYNLKRFYIHET
nr:hypothetical protein [Tanacetum cinerariifolium]